MSKVITADQAAALIKDEAVLAATGFGLAGWAEEIACAIEKRFLETAHPKDLTLVHASAIGDRKERGTTRIAKQGLIKRWIGSHVRSSANMARLVAENKVEAYCFPQGSIVHLYREIAANRPGLLTKVGIGTFVDPRLQGGKMNPMTTKPLSKVVNFEGDEWLFYPSFPINVAIIRGTTVDEDGNLTMEKEGPLLEGLPLAQAAKSSGGIVIVQAEYLAKSGTLHPKQVKVPGILVDYVVIATKPENSWQAMGTRYNPAFSGDMIVPLEGLPEFPLDDRKIIARRAAMELLPFTVTNLGVGIPSDVAAVAAEEGVSHLMTLTTEAGGIGGVPASHPNFGQIYNCACTITHDAQFDFYDGGGVDVAFLGLAEVDKSGNVNVSMFKGRAIGCGGFINISQSSKKIVYCGTFTAGGLEVAAKDGKLAIMSEGRGKKFVNEVEQISFSGKYATKVGQPVLFVTERAVFELENGELTLIEIAPGVDLEKDVLGMMEFKPKISPQLKTMPEGIFQPVWGGLKQVIEAKTK